MHTIKPARSFSALFSVDRVTPHDSVVPPSESNLRSVPPPVKIDPDVTAERYRLLLKQIREGDITLADLKLIRDWLSVVRYVPAKTKWKKVFREGIKLVGFDKEPQTILKRHESAMGMDVDEWWRVYAELSAKKK